MKNGTQAQPKLSAASKMPCKSWSLPAWITCPGARKDNGEAVDACSHCFALQGRYTFGAVKAVRDHNMEDWKRSDWVSAMVRSIGKSKFFRWFDSGDIYTPELAKKIIEVVFMTPNCKHWIPTRAYKDYSILPYLQKLDAMDNCVVRYSSDSVNGETIPFAEHNSSILQSADDFIPGIGKVLCRSYTRKGKCGDCRACWSKKIITVFYPIHGRKVKTFPQLTKEMEV
jgi:hypothetical protein